MLRPHRGLNHPNSRALELPATPIRPALPASYPHSCPMPSTLLCNLRQCLFSLVCFPHCAARGWIPGSLREPTTETDFLQLGNEPPQMWLDQVPNCSPTAAGRLFEGLILGLSPLGLGVGKDNGWRQKGHGITCGKTWRTTGVGQRSV